jgi:hypothetical protein
MSRIFLKDKNGRRAVFGKQEKMQTDPHFKDYILFFEYFHGDTGRGVGASHQTGWTGIIAFLPWGVFTSLFRPLPGEVNIPFGVLAGLEDAVLIFFAIRALVRAGRSRLRDPVVLWDLAFVLIWASMYGLISANNLGAGVRYRTQILPSLILLLLYLGRPRASLELQDGARLAS